MRAGVSLHITMAKVHTSPPHLSVWQDVSRKDFEYNVTRIQSSTRWTGLPMRQNTAQEDNSAILSIAMEKQLAHDLAFVAISDTGPQAVRSPTVQVFQNPKQFVMALASNERAPKEVQGFH